MPPDFILFGQEALRLYGKNETEIDHKAVSVICTNRAEKGKAKELGSQLDNKTITVEGEVIDYKGKPEPIVTDPSKTNF